MSNKLNQNKDSILVYSTDPKDQDIISGKAALAKKASHEKQLVDTQKFTVVFRIEKNGRGGKIVTVMDKFPAHETFLKELTKEFKKKCGVGGSYKLEGQFGLIEIQGDKREALKKILETKQIKFKGM